MDEDPVLLQLQRTLAAVYQVEQLLGRGAIASVYRATEINPRRPVAVKVLQAGLGQGAAAPRFKREARLAAGLVNPNIVPIYRIGLTAGSYFFAMKLVEGRALDAILESQGPLPVSVILVVLHAAAEALAYAHQRGAVHGDVSGANILVDRTGLALVSDFCLARAVEEDLPAGSRAAAKPRFVSPEQAAGGAGGPASDQYSLGIVALEMILGSVPPGTDPLIALSGVRSVREELPDGLMMVVRRALATDPARRYPSAADMLGAIDAVPFSDAERGEAGAILGQLARGEPVPRLPAPAVPPGVPGRTSAAYAPIGLPTKAAPAAPAARTPATVPGAKTITAMPAVKPTPTAPAARTPTTAPGAPPPKPAPTPTAPAQRVVRPTPTAPAAPAAKPAPPPPRPTPPPSVPPTRVEPAITAEPAEPARRVARATPGVPPTRVEPAITAEPGDWAEIAEVAEPAAAAKPVAAERAAPAFRMPLREESESKGKSRLVWIGAAVVVLGLAFAAWWVLGRRPAASNLAQAPAASVPAQPVAPPAAPVVAESARRDTVHKAPAARDTASADTAAETTGLLLISTVPNTAEILVDGQSAGATGFMDSDVTAGRRRVKVSAPGYSTFDTTVNVRAGATLSLQIALRGSAPEAPEAAATPATGKLRLRTVPSTAEIFVDGKSVGVGVLVDFEVPSGQRQLRISAPGYETLDTLVTVDAGATLRLGQVPLKSSTGGP